MRIEFPNVPHFGGVQPPEMERSQPAVDVLIPAAEPELPGQWGRVKPLFGGPRLRRKRAWSGEPGNPRENVSPRLPEEELKVPQNQLLV